MQSKTVSEFDEHLTAPLFGYKSVEEYYKATNNSDKLHKISIPYICLTATDDPFVPEKCEGENIILPLQYIQCSLQCVVKFKLYVTKNYCCWPLSMS